MTNHPIISICIPAYNRCSTLKESIESIVTQFDGEIEKFVEVIIADDASPDLSIQDMVNEFKKKYNNIKYIRYPVNKGLTYNITAVTTYANGEYLRLLTDDDCITKFSLGYVLEIIKKNRFDLMVCKFHFGPDMHISIPKTENTYTILHGMNKFIDYLYDTKKTYEELMVHFSFYSVLIVNNQYFKESLSHQNQEFIYSTIFPQDIIIYTGIKNDKIIIIPDNIFTLGRTLNESYKTNVKFITDFELSMNMIEDANGLQGSKKWQKIKKTCISGWKKTIYLGFILRRLRIDYKKNYIFKKMYLFYKKYLQNQRA